MRCVNLEKRLNKYSIRKMTFGTSSILVASLFFIGSGAADAAENNHTAQPESNITQNEVTTETSPVHNAEQATDKPAKKTEPSVTQEATEANQPAEPDKNPSPTPETNQQQSDKQNVSEETPPLKQTATSLPKSNEQTLNQTHANSDNSHNVQENNETTNVNPQTPEQQTTNDISEKSAAATENNPKPTSENKATSAKQSSYPIEKYTQDTLKKVQNQNATIKRHDNAAPSFPNKAQKAAPAEETTADSPKEQGTNNQTSLKKVSDNVTQNIEQTLPKAEEHTFSAPPEQPNKITQQPRQSSTSKTQPPETVNPPQPTVEDKKAVVGHINTQNPSAAQPAEDKNGDSHKGIETLGNNANATTNNKNTAQTSRPVTDQTNKSAKQQQFKNRDPIILVHGFNGLVGETAGPASGNYWGGDRTDLQKDLEENGYNVYEASIGAYGSNYDRAVELYYYIKGGTVDYGSAHAEKYGHKRYGKTYEGVYPEWQPGQKVHLVGHSMGGQTIRQLEEFLRNGNQEEIDYQKAHGGTISPLFQGSHDNMVTSITTVASPHNGTHAADVGNEAFIRQVLYDNMKLQGNKYSQVDYGLAQWGFKQDENESYPDYVERVKKQSKLWTTTDNALYDLSRKGAKELNDRTSLNPNIVYKSYTGESTRPGLNGRQRADIHMAASKHLTGNVIGKAEEKEWRENDGLVSTISAQHPFNQASTPATDEVQKGIWQVSPIQHDWDHGDFVGTDATEAQIKTQDVRNFWLGIADDAVKSEAVTG